MKPVHERFRLSLPLALVAVVLLLGLYLVGWRSMTSPPGAAGTAFTAQAGMATLTELLGEQTPHPAGSAAHAVVRDRLVAALTAAGYTPTVDTSFHCSPNLGCAQVENIIAIQRGTDSRDAVLATAHYDGVPAGPGISDDGVGTAVMLELARHRSKQPPPRNDIIFLFSDAEELGLVGAHAFAVRDPAMARIRAVVNVEARGTGGPSVMFETGSGNAELMKRFAQTVKYPVANSLTFEIYKRLPNGTDFTMYSDRGIIGYNFACLGNASRYHTPEDDLAHLDRDSLQHQGDHAFATVEMLASTDLTTLKSDHDASYFDVFGRFLVRWPAPWNLPLATVALIAVIAWILGKRRQFQVRPVLWSVLAIVATPVLMIVLGFALAFPLGHWPGALRLDHPMPWPGRFALLFAAVLVSLGLAIFAHRRGAATALAAICWLVLTSLTAAVAATVPGAAYALLWPSVGFAITASVLWRRDSGLRWASGVGFVLAGFFWTGHLVMFESALGFGDSHLKAATLVPLCWALMPLLAGVLAGHTGRLWPSLVGCAAAMLAAATTAALVAATSPACRQGHNIVYFDDGRVPPRWLVQTMDPPDQAYLAAAGMPSSLTAYSDLSGFPDEGAMKPVRDVKIAPPTFTPDSDTVTGDRRRITGKLHVGATALRAGFAIGAGSGLLALRVEGNPVWNEAKLADGRARWFRIGGVHDRDLAIELELTKDARGPISIYEISSLPDAAESKALQSLRPDRLTTNDNGDSSMVVRQIKL